MGPSSTRKNGRGYRYYTCRYASKHGHGECPTPSVSAGLVEEAVVHQLRAVFRSPEMIAKTFAAAKKMESSGPNGLQSEKKELEGRLGALKTTAAKALGNGRGGPVGERVEDLTAEIREVEYRLEEVSRRLAIRGGSDLNERDVADALNQLDPVWDELFPAEQARIVKLLVERVVVTPDCLEIRIRAAGLHSVIAELRGEGIPVEASVG